MPESSTRDFLTAIPAWSRFLGEFDVPDVFPQERALEELRRRCVNLSRRFRDGPHAPMRIAFFGPTGAGKSKLFCSLVGKTISNSGFKRPFTRTSCYYVHDEWQPIVAALEGKVEMHQRDAWKEMIVIDTPDFDSVDLSNRDEAERVFLEADDFLFVTDSLKYADASTWEYLARIHTAEKEFAVILNKTSSEAIPESFDKRYRDTFDIPPGDALPYSKIVVPEFSIPDDALIDSEHESMKKLNSTIATLAGDNSAEQSVTRFRGELDGIFSESKRLREKTAECRGQIVGLQERLDERYKQSIDHLDFRLAEGLSPSVRNEVYQRVTKELEKIDLLRVPRRIISMPIKGIHSMYKKWTGKADEDDSDKRAESASDPVTSETFHLLESELIRFADESRLDIIKQPGFENLVSREKYKELRLEHAEIQKLFREHHERFRGWVESHALDTASSITGENKAKFILSQVLFHTVLVSAQVSTGGAFTLFELGFDGVVSPFVAKAVSIAIGDQKVKEFERTAHKKHQESLMEVLAVGKKRYDDFLEDSSRGLSELETMLGEMSEYEPQTDSLVDQFGSSVVPGASRDD